MNRTTKIWILFAVIIAFASFLRLYHITTTPTGLYPDEAMDGNNALEVIQTGHFQVFYTEDNGREGLYVNTLVFAIEAFGHKPWVVRLPAAITANAAIVIISILLDFGFFMTGIEEGRPVAFLLLNAAGDAGGASSSVLSSALFTISTSSLTLNGLDM